MMGWSYEIDKVESKKHFIVSKRYTECFLCHSSTVVSNFLLLFSCLHIPEGICCFLFDSLVRTYEPLITF